MERLSEVCQSVQMRRFNHRVPHETIIGVTLIIGENQNNIGRLRITCLGDCRHEEQGNQKVGIFHVVDHSFLRSTGKVTSMIVHLWRVHPEPDFYPNGHCSLALPSLLCIEIAPWN